MLRGLLATAAVAGAMLLTPSVAGLAPAADASSAAATACAYQRSGNHWNCVTPGAYCPKAAHGRAGYAKATGRRHTCARYSNGQWRWKRARANAKCPLPAGGPAGEGRCHRRRAGVVPSVVVDDASTLRAC
ncbi:hypothetical protein [Streptosporangium sandarakinum]|uniref:hypothetical protein n=1 Tax=Streptosporangium sandarakinum TaxID=1260955 RepID=UPI00371878FB